MPREMPFDDDVMTLIMGLGGPEKPGQHGRTMVPAPENKAIDTITQIRDLCEDFLKSAGKDEGEDKKPDDAKPGEAGDSPEGDMEEK